ncbi:MAG: electron transfer flavoprotein subunit beta/FixA family protein, partial [Candidatus Aminicenantales bacterium]
VLSLPAVVSAQKGLNEPRYETLKGIMAAKKKPVPVVTLDELGFGADELVPAVEPVGLDVPAARQAGKVLKGEPAETARELVRLLRDEAKVI